MSMRNGPNGEFQLTPTPTERRGLGELPRKRSVNGAMRRARQRFRRAGSCRGAACSSPSAGQRALVEGERIVRIDVEQGRPANAEHRADIDEHRRPEAKIAHRGAERNFELGAAEIVSAAADRIVGDLLSRLVQRDIRRGQSGWRHRYRQIADALDARTDAANVEAADLRAAEEEAVGQADRIDRRACRSRSCGCSRPRR